VRGDIAMKYDDHDRDRARDLRQRMNRAERDLWKGIRNRLRRYKFRRQHPLGPYSADFYCATARLVVELDGITHEDRQEEDAERDRWMKEKRMEVLRIQNQEVYDDVGAVIDRIEAVCRLLTE
jgi:very-short-patch-repair endonuclease